jgi:hypothetical protein
MGDLDPTVGERLLGEYPKLLDQWRRRINEYAQEPSDYGLWRAHQPKYLERVVQQHRWLTEGPGDSPDPKLARRCEEIVARDPAVQQERAEALADPWWRAAAVGDGGKMIIEFYDPDYLERLVERRQRTDNPDPGTADGTDLYGGPARIYGSVSPCAQAQRRQPSAPRERSGAARG